CVGPVSRPRADRRDEGRRRAFAIRQPARSLDGGVSMAQGEAADAPGLAARIWHRLVASAPGRVVSLGVRTVNRFIECHGARQGAAVAFYAAFSMAPLLVVVTSLLVWLLGDQSANAT